MEFRKLTYKEIISNYECLICLASVCVAVVVTLYIECILAIELNVFYDVSEVYIGFYFLVAALTYILGPPISDFLTRH